MEMSEVAGITKQREGQIANRETVGGVERATLQSSHITEWLFTIHEDLKKRVLECFLETAKIAFKGRKIKFNYILNDGSNLLVEIDGDDYVVPIVINDPDDVDYQSLRQERSSENRVNLNDSNEEGSVNTDWSNPSTYENEERLIND